MLLNLKKQGELIVVQTPRNLSGRSFKYEGLHIAFQNASATTVHAEIGDEQFINLPFAELEINGVPATSYADLQAKFNAEFASSSGGGGGSFNGQLTQGGSNVSNENPLPVRGSVTPAMASGGNISAQTAATGINWTAYGSQACKQLTLSNQSGTTIEVRQGGAGVGFQIPTGAFYTFFGITNANQLDVRRVDTSNTQVTITARWEA